MLKIIIKILVSLVVVTTLVSIIIFALLVSNEWQPRANERNIYNRAGGGSQHAQLPDTLKLVSWNIGYGGLGADMDFFYDGGVQTRCSEEQTINNLDAIIAQLQSLDDVDFVLLQEVDINSKRSYHMNQFEMIFAALNYPYYAVALNYSSTYVPIPLRDPMGGVKSGLVVLSRHPISESIRRQYPSNVGLPNRLFDLKRAMLSVAIKSSENDILWINNTHNSAFDDGAMRREEIQFIDSVIFENPRSITAGDWNSTPPGVLPSKEALENQFFAPIPLSQKDLSAANEILFDETTSTVRYLDFPYVADKSVTTIVDFAVSGDKCAIIESKTLELGYLNSDHNPIIITFVAEN